MLVLAVDTAGEAGGVLLARAEDPTPGAMEILNSIVLEPRKFSTQLIPAIEEILKEHRLEISHLDAFAVFSGPGSFTGLRVGLSAVKAMAEVTGKPVIAVSRLAVMAAAVSNSEFAGETVHTLLDAGRGEFYHGIYRNGGRTCVSEALETMAVLKENLDSVPGVVVTSEPAVLASLNRLPGVILLQIPLAIVREALPLVVAAWRDGRFSDITQLDANYLRRAEPGAAGTAKPRTDV